MNREPGWKRLSLSRRTFIKTLGLACVAGSPVLKACNLSSGESHRPEEKLEMNRHSDDSGVLRSPRPPIDLAAPARTETATFALG